MTEILTRYLKDTVAGPPGADDVVRGYRGGYLPNRRREIEKGLRDGDVRAVVATSALELGIDIGALDVAGAGRLPGHDRRDVAAGRPGRAGASGQSAAVLVASSAPLDQYIVRNPSYFFDASPEHALINADNLQILLAHIKCAAFELPFGDERGVRARERAADPRDPRGGRPRAPRRGPGARRGGALALDQRVVPGRRDQPAVGLVRQLRRRGQHRPRARDRRDRLHQRASPRCTRRRSTSSRARSTRWSGSTSTTARRSCARWSATTTRTPSATTG